jgi:hypothetical protein
MTKWNDALDAYCDAIKSSRVWNDALDAYHDTIKSSSVQYDKIEYRGVTVNKVIFNDPATIVLWSDGTKTVVKCQEGDVFDPEKGLAMAISKKALGNKGNFNEVFKKWLPDEEKSAVMKALENLSKTITKFKIPKFDVSCRFEGEKENV